MKVLSEDQEMKNIFYQEANELVEQLEQDILSLESNIGDKDIINRIFRAAHTIKGSASFVGFMNLSSFSHKMENVLDLVRKDEIVVNEILITVLLNGLDAIKRLLAEPENEALINDEQILSTISEFNQFLPNQSGNAIDTPKMTKQEDTIYKIDLVFNKEIFETGTDPLILIDELLGMGEIVEYNIRTSELPDIYKLDPYTLYVSWNIILKVNNTIPKKDLEDIFIFVMDDNDIKIQEIEEKDLNIENKKLGELLVDKGLVKESDVQGALEKQNKLGEILVQEGKIMPAQVEKVAQQQQDAKKTKESATIRVDITKLDKLMNLVGELVINQARVAQIASHKDKINVLELTSAADGLDRITRDLQEQIMRARMIPIENTFSQFQRMVRDTAKEIGKDIKLNIIGKETELDKTIIELINDPLKHMIRNSIDHGVETTEERLAKGKPAQGTITLNAYYEAGNIVIEISDDGNGLNKEKILSKAKDKGLVSPDKELNEDEIYQLIFLPGFSTADQISEISGRGVGMDVVKNNITRLRGSIDIQTKEGFGTTFRIILPLTLAIIDGMLVKVGQELYIIPLLSIVESIRPKDEDIKHVNTESEVINVRGEYIPLIRLYDLFNIETEHKNPSKALTVIVTSGKNKACLLVDDIIGQQQAVIKSLEENFSAINGISGATILGDGTLAMILDISTIIRIAANSK